MQDEENMMGKNTKVSPCQGHSRNNNGTLINTTGIWKRTWTITHRRRTKLTLYPSTVKDVLDHRSSSQQVAYRGDFLIVCVVDAQVSQFHRQRVTSWKQKQRMHLEGIDAWKNFVNRF
jgi:hypothetical protein